MVGVAAAGAGFKRFFGGKKEETPKPAVIEAKAENTEDEVKF